MKLQLRFPRIYMAYRIELRDGKTLIGVLMALR